MHGLGLLEGACIAGFAWGLSHMVSDLFGKPASLGNLALPMAATIFSLAARALLNVVNQKLAMQSARRIIRAIRLDIMAKALGGHIDSGRHQARLNALFEDSEALEGYYARFRQNDFQARILPLVFIALMALASPISAGILLLTLLPFVAMMAVLGLTSAGESKRQLDALSRLSNLFVDRIRALPLILSFEAGPRQVHTVGRAAHEVAERRVDHAMARQRQLAGERRADHERLEMHAVRAVHLDLRLRHALLDQTLHGRTVHLLRFLGRSADGRRGAACDAGAA